MAVSTSLSCQCGNDIPGIVTLGVVNAAIGPGLVIINPITGEETPSNLFQIGIADSGTGKSRVMKKLQQPLVDFEKSLTDDWNKNKVPELKARESELKIKIKASEKRMKAALEDESQGPFIIESLRTELTGLNRQMALAQEEPVAPRILVQDVTTQKLSLLLQDNNERIISLSADAREAVNNIMGRYNESKTDESIYLSAFSGERYTCDRITRGSVVLQQPCVSLTWLIQEDKADEMLDSKALREGGFLPRCLISYTDAKPGPMVGGQKIPENVQKNYSEAVLLVINGYFRQTNKVSTTMTEQAANLLREFHNSKVKKWTDGDRDGWSFQTRHTEHVTRIALTLHVMKHTSNSHLNNVDEETMANAIKLMNWYSKAHQKLIERASYIKLQSGIKKVTDLLIKNPPGFEFREACRARIAGSQKSEATQKLLDKLIASGFLRIVKDGEKSRYRKAT